jgi:hypothetical protein
VRRLGFVAISFLSACFTQPDYENLLCSAGQPCPPGFICAAGRCSSTIDAGRSEHDGGRTELGDVGEDAGADDGAVSDAGGDTNCAPCDLPAKTCAENDTVYRTYLRLGACPNDPALCTYAIVDIECPDCTNACLSPCMELTCDQLEGGCRRAGYCVLDLGTAACAYVAEVDSSTCAAENGSQGVCRSGVCFACQENQTCDDGDACTENDTCLNGQCVGDPITCNDQNECTDDRCDAVLGCIYTEHDRACSDGDLCTYDDHCTGGTCTGTAITCTADDCMDRACDGTATCAEQPRAYETACTSDGNACTRDICDGSGSCVHNPQSDGTSCGANDAQRCCNSECVDISRDTRHCGGCGTACDSGFACEPIENSPSCGANYPARVSGRCLCQGANSQCPNNRGQVCRLTTFLDGNRCVPDSSTAMPCSAGQTIEVVSQCPAYCAY